MSNQNNIFNNQNNIKIIKSIITDDISKENNVNIGTKYDNIINDTIKYVESKGGTKPPKNMSSEQFLLLMNKKVYDISVPIIKKNIESNNKLNKLSTGNNINNNTNTKGNINQNNTNKLTNNTNNIHTNNNINKSNNNSLITPKNKVASYNPSDNIFDPELLRQFETIDTLMEYPKPEFSNKKVDEQFNNRLKNLEDERTDLKPKLRPIDFSLKRDEPENVDNTIKKFNDLIDSIGIYDNKDAVNKHTNQNINNINRSSNIIQSNNVTQSNNVIQSNNVTQSNNVIQSNNITQPYNINDNNIEKFTTIETLLKPNNYYDPINIVNDNSYSQNISNVITNFNNDRIVQNTTQKLEFSSFKEEGNNLIVKEPTFNLLEYTEYVIIDSSDRDLELWPNPTQFQVKFSPASSNLLFTNYYDENGTLILREKNVVYGNTNSADIDKIFDNIKSIICVSSTVPINNVNIATSNNVTSYLNIFQEPYLFLEIPELRGPYRSLNKTSRNAFSKLKINYADYTSIVEFGNPSNISYFTTLQTVKDESFIYQNTTLGKIDKMTLTLTNKNGNLYNVGIDKLFVQSIRKGNLINSGYCGEQFYSTIITIQQENNEYSKYCNLYYKSGNCNYLNSIPLLFGDYLQFYSVYPNDDQIAYLEEYVKVYDVNIDVAENKIIFKIGYLSDGNIVNVNLRYIIPDLNEYNLSQYYLILYDKSDNTTYYLKIISITNDTITVNYINLPTLNYDSFVKIGIAKGNLRGNVNYDSYNMSLFNYGGFYALSSEGDNNFEVEINFPYEKLPAYLKNMEYYNPGDIFFIQKKLQISYTFAITYFEKDYKPTLTSLLNETSSK